jgi:hypothetical protein
MASETSQNHGLVSLDNLTMLLFDQPGSESNDVDLTEYQAIQLERCVVLPIAAKS